MQAPKGPKPSAGAVKAKPRARPSGGKSKATKQNQSNSDVNSMEGGSASAQTLVRKSQGEGGSSKKRAKKGDSDDSARHGLLDDEDNADRRAVEELVEAAVGQPSASQKEKAKQKNGASRKRSPGKLTDVGGAAGLESPEAGVRGALGGSPMRSGVAASLLGSLGLGSLPFQVQEYQELRKRIEQQQLVQQALQLAAQRMQQHQGTAGGAASAAQAEASVPNFSLHQPPQLAANGAAAIPVMFVMSMPISIWNTFGNNHAACKSPRTCVSL